MFSKSVSLFFVFYPIVVKNQPIVDILAGALFLIYPWNIENSKNLRLYPLVLSHSDYNRRILYASYLDS